MVEVQKDPIQPPKFKINRKIPRGPPSPPVPVLHSPPRMVTTKEQHEWKIPPCISNWKNNHGYTIPLDKRLAVDGRELLEINGNFAKLSQSLYIAEADTREAVKRRNQLQLAVSQKQYQANDEKLRLLAQKAREDQAEIHIGVTKDNVEARERDQLYTLPEAQGEGT